MNSCSNSTHLSPAEQEVLHLRHHLTLRGDEVERLREFILPLVAKAPVAVKVGYFQALGEQGQVDLARDYPALFEEIEQGVLPTPPSTIEVR